MKRARTDAAKDARRNALLRAALDELFERGLNAARMDDIAARAGVTKGTLYLYFPSKESLFLALIEQLAKPNLARIEAIATQAASFAQAMEALATFAPAMIRNSDLPRLMKIMIGESQSFPGIVADYRRDVLDRLLGAIATLLERARAAGEIHFSDAQLTARLVIAPIAFSALWRAVFGQAGDAAVDLESLFEQHARILQTALSAGEER